MTLRITRRRFVQAVPLSTGAALLAACAQAPATPTAAPPTTAPPATSAPAPTAAAPAPTSATKPTVAPTAALTVAAAASPTAQAAVPADLAPDQTLRLVSIASAATIEPAKEGGHLRMMTENMFIPPFYLDKTGKMQPGVCTTWEVSDDGLTYTLHVNPRAKFSDGTQVTAQDIKFSWEHVTDPATKTWTAPYLTAPIVGYADVVAGKTKDLKGLVAKDDLTLQVTLANPDAPFIKTTADWIAGIVQKKNVESGKDWDLHPVTVGPYTITSYNRDTGAITWVPDKNWWGNKPIIQKITYQYVKDANTQAIMYDNNEMDIFQAGNIVPLQMLKGPHAQEMISTGESGSFFFVLHTDRKPMDDVNVRRAFLKASDMATAVKAVFGDGVKPAFGLIPPSIEGYNNPKSYFDPEGAKKALAESSYKTADNLPPISFAVGSNLPEYVRIAEALQQMWKQNLGVTADVHEIQSGSDPNVQKAQFLRASLGVWINDPAGAVSAMGLAENMIADGFQAKGFQNPKGLDDIIQKANAMAPRQEAERIKLYQQAEQQIMDLAYFIPIHWIAGYYGVKPWVKNADVNLDTCFYDVTRMYITKH